MTHQTKNCVIKYGDINIQNIVYDDFILANDGKHVVSKVWYQDSEYLPPHTFYIQTHNLKIHEIPEDENGDLLLVLDDTEVFENLDKRAVSQIKAKDVHKKYGLIKPTYKSSINNPDDNDSIEVLRLKVGNCNFFYKDKSPKKIGDILKTKLLQKGSYVRVIIEIGMVMMNIEQNFIFTNLILKQAQIYPLVPKVIDISEYSFVDDEPEQNMSQNSINIDDVILNTQTEYMNSETPNKNSSESTKSNWDVPINKSLDAVKLILNNNSNKSDNSDSRDSRDSRDSNNSSNNSSNDNDYDHSYTNSTNSSKSDKSSANSEEDSDEDVEELLKHIAQINSQKQNNVDEIHGSVKSDNSVKTTKATKIAKTVKPKTGKSNKASLKV